MNAQGKGRMAYKVLYSSLLAVGMAALPATAAPIDGLGPFAFPGFCDPLGSPVHGYDNANPNLLGAWTDLRHPLQINSVPDPELPGPEGCMLELNGSTGSTGDMWITLLDPPAIPGEQPIVGCATIRAQVKIKKFDNRKAVGFVTHYSSVSHRGLFLGLYDNGNTDALTLSTFEATNVPATPAKLLSTVVTLPLGALIKENVWYTLQVTNLCVNGLQVTGNANVFGPPDSGLPPAGSMPINTTLLPVIGVPEFGQIGVAGHAKSSFVDSNVRLFDASGSEGISPP